MWRGSTRAARQATVVGRVQDYGGERARAATGALGVFTDFRCADTTDVSRPRDSPGTDSAASPDASELNDALREIWIRHRPVALERIGALEHAAELWRDGCFDDARREEARSDAHRLAGSLGTFGLIAATERARRAERLLDGAAPAGGRPAAALAQLAASLRALVETAAGAASSSTETAVAAPAAAHDALPLLLIVEHDTRRAGRLTVEAERSGMCVAHAPDPPAARAALAAARPDAVLLDVTNAPDDAHALLSELTATSPPIPVLVSTGCDDLAERIEVARRGGRGFVAGLRPPAEVIEQVTQLVARTQAAAPTLLAVDDDPAVLDAVDHLLGADGFHVVTLAEPTRFWEELERVQPDLVLLDVEMPGVSGIELCRVVRSDPSWAAVPVLILTTRRDEATIEQIFAAGADDYLAKPVLAPELRVRVRNRLERLQLHRALSELDGLTGVANRHTATHSLERLLRLAKRNEQSLALALVDLDHFKQVNDTHGHPAGDEVLRRFGQMLRQAFRGEDVVGRWGGEEFAVAMYGMSAADAAVRLEHLLDVFGRERFVGGGALGNAFRVGFSAGVACFPADGEDLGALQHASDAALYRAKDAGRGCVRVADASAR